MLTQVGLYSPQCDQIRLAFPFTSHGVYWTIPGLEVQWPLVILMRLMYHWTDKCRLQNTKLNSDKGYTRQRLRNATQASLYTDTIHCFASCESLWEIRGVREFLQPIGMWESTCLFHLLFTNIPEIDSLSTSTNHSSPAFPRCLPCR